MHRVLYILCSCLFLTSCGGPLALVPYAMGAGVALKAGSEDRKMAWKERYRNKCLPIEKKKDAFLSGVDAEARGELVYAYEYYQIAEWIGDGRGAGRLLAVRQKMKPNQLHKAEKNIQDFTRENIESCYVRMSGA